MKQIKFNDNVLTVTELYPYQYQNGTEVIRIKVSEENHAYSDIASLRTGTDSIEYIEDDVLMNVYEGYTESFKSSFQSGTWTVELTRKSEEQRRIDELESAVIELAALVGGAE
ncbi:MAG: hypothetical protein ACI4CT_05340 [Lachnospiraceae bacterium]